MSTVSHRDDSITSTQKDHANSNNANADGNRNSNNSSAHDFQLDECYDSNSDDGNATFSANNGGGFITQPDFILNDDYEGNSTESHHFEYNDNIHTEGFDAEQNAGDQSGCGGREKEVRRFDPVQRSPSSQGFPTPEKKDVHTDNNLSREKDEQITRHGESKGFEEDVQDDADKTFAKKLSSPLRPPRGEKSPVRKPPFHFEHSITHVLAGEINQKFGIVSAVEGVRELEKSSASIEKSTKANWY